MRCTEVTPGLQSTVQITGEHLHCSELQIITSQMAWWELHAQMDSHSFMCLLVGMPPPVVSVWYYPPTMNTTSRQTWVMWCCSSSVSTERQGFEYSVFLRCSTKMRWKNEHHPPSLWQICSRCCPAPLNPQGTCFWLQGDHHLSLLSLFHSFSVREY